MPDRDDARPPSAAPPPTSSPGGAGDGPALIGFARRGVPGPQTIVGKLMMRPSRFGYVALALGAALVAIGLARGHVSAGPALIVMGLGWVAAESVPVTRLRERLMVIAASMAIGIVVETALRWSRLL